MKERSVTHATFTIERTYDASPARVFAAWANPVAKRRWSVCHDEGGAAEYALDFRIGGRERLRASSPGGTTHAVDGHYLDIVPDQRIVYAYDMLLNDARVSVSLVTVEFKPEGTGTRMVFTEQGAFLDGHDTPAQREHGTNVGMDRLIEELQREAVAA
ncbi:SRPBCC family protein [Chondromyces apiculatus]|uniref:Putative glutathione S-transferase-related transmembrane protein n=1 Tax=Chondromyces apiculatus DSM 436 TaxID=1192034 RepID=A0A017T3I0_9BACT|nr:SRPBCC family protein [Chondromyces apiculatus]EYF03814.1 putative glutathione S-transferase-related transmembrane protein [Chondromyces apiculatus DSM 436]